MSTPLGEKTFAATDAGQGNTPMAYQLGLHGIDAPNWNRRSGGGQQIACGTMSLAALEAS